MRRPSRRQTLCAAGCAALVTIVDNASTDDTAAIASRLTAQLPGVTSMRLERKGRGHALRTAWSSSDAPVLAYMDVDLSTSLPALLPHPATLRKAQKFAKWLRGAVFPVATS